MSERCAGNLILAKNAHVALDALHKAPLKAYYKDLNVKWGVIYVEDDFSPSKETLEWLKRLSNSIPILRFIQPADIGWGYQVFFNGQEIATCYENFELAFDCFVRLGEKYYPQEIDIVLFLFDNKDIYKNIQEEALSSKEYNYELSEQFANKNTPCLVNFELTPDQIASLDEILVPKENFQKHKSFKEILGISEFIYSSFEEELYQELMSDLHTGEREQPGDQGHQE